MKNINELTRNELKVVWRNNSHLQHDVFNIMMDDAHRYNCEEILPCFPRKAIDYAMGYDRGAYFTAREPMLFMVGLKEAQRNYCFLSDDYYEMIAEADRLIEMLYRSNELDEAQEAELETKLDEIIEELQDACFERFMDEYRACFDDESQLDYFLSCYIENELDDDFYVDDDYILYEDISYTKCYK